MDSSPDNQDRIPSDLNITTSFLSSLAVGLQQKLDEFARAAAPFDPAKLRAWLEAANEFRTFALDVFRDLKAVGATDDELLNWQKNLWLPVIEILRNVFLVRLGCRPVEQEIDGIPTVVSTESIAQVLRMLSSDQAEIRRLGAFVLGEAGATLQSTDRELCKRALGDALKRPDEHMDVKGRMIWAMVEMCDDVPDPNTIDLLRSFSIDENEPQELKAIAVRALSRIRTN